MPCMTERRLPSIAKWPYYIADVVLVGLAFWIVNHYPHPLPLWPATLMAGCVVAAAVLGVWPHRAEYQTAVQAADAGGWVCGCGCRARCVAAARGMPDGRSICRGGRTSRCHQRDPRCADRG